MDEVKRVSPKGERKRAYEPPDVEDSTQFETLALTCAKTPGDESCAYGSGYELS